MATRAAPRKGSGKIQARGITAPLQNGSTVQGTVVSYSQKNGYGFIGVPDQPVDIYFKRDAVDPASQDSVAAGTTVQVTVQLTQDHQPQAQRMEVLPTPPPGYVPPEPVNRGTKRQAGQQAGWAQHQASPAPKVARVGAFGGGPIAGYSSGPAQKGNS